MTADRVLELLRELRHLQLMASTIESLNTRRDTRAAWMAVAAAIDDRCALLRAVLVLNADADILQACERSLAVEQQAGAEDVRMALRASSQTHDRLGDAHSKSDREPFAENGNPAADLPRVTIH